MAKEKKAKIDVKAKRASLSEAAIKVADELCKKYDLKDARYVARKAVYSVTERMKK